MNYNFVVILVANEQKEWHSTIWVEQISVYIIRLNIEVNVKIEKLIHQIIEMRTWIFEWDHNEFNVLLISYNKW